MSHGAVIANHCGSNTRAFKDVQKVGQDLQSLQAAHGTTRTAAKVAIVFDYDNMWGLDDARNYANETKKYWRTIQEHYQYFWKHDIPVEIIATTDDLTAYDLVIDPMHFMMSAQFATKLKAYVQQGGHLIGTYITGVVDHDFLAYQGDGLADLEATYGIKVQETDTLYPQQHNALTAYHQAYQVNDYCDVVETTTAQVLGTYQKDFYAGTPAVTVNQLGQGAAYYLAARTDTDFLDAFYERLATSLALKPALPVIKANAKVSIQVRENATTRYYFVINFSHRPTTVTLEVPLRQIFENQVVSGKQDLASYGVQVYMMNK